MTDILNRINKRLISVYFNNKRIFEFFSRNDFIYNHFILFNRVLVVEYLNHSYFFYNLDDSYHQIVKTKYKIDNFLMDLSKKTLQACEIICIVKSNNNKENTIHLKKYNLNKFTNKDQITYYSKIYNNGGALNEFMEKYSYKSFCEFDNIHFVIISHKNIFLFEKFNSFSVLLQTLDISFATIPYPIVQNDLLIISSELFIYKLGLKVKDENSFSIFKDMTLNFNNEKYKEMLETLKVVVYYNMEIDEIPFNELKLYMNNIFQEYDIFSYVENLSHTLNEDNVLFFLSYNLNTSKLLVIFIFSLIFENYKFLTNIFKLLIFNTNNDSVENHIQSSYKCNMHFISFLILLEEFIIDFFKDFVTINMEEFLRNVNEKLFTELDEKDDLLNNVNQFILMLLKK